MKIISPFLHPKSVSPITLDTFNQFDQLPAVSERAADERL